MNLTPLFKRVMMGAAEATLDIAGSAVLPGAWPILKGALQPVINRLKERLGGDITSSPQRAKEAVAAFEADPHLQEMLRSNLLEALEPVVQGQAEIQGDIQKLMLIVSGDQRRLDEIVGGVERVERRLDEGVNLSDEAVARLAEAVRRQAENSREVRALAREEAGPVAAMAERQLHRLQIRAVELLREGALDRAADELREGVAFVAVLLNEAPSDPGLRIALGFIYKTLCQVFMASGDEAQARSYAQRAERIFRFVTDELPAGGKTAEDTANALHGLANMQTQRGELRAAIRNYETVVTLSPGHMYAWHDMLAAYFALAERDEVDLEAMRRALEMVKRTGKGAPGLGADYIEALEARLRRCEGPPHPTGGS